MANPPPSYQESINLALPRPATDSNCYDQDPKKMSIQMEFYPEPAAQTLLSQPWVYVLQIKCGNVPEMMVEGLIITPENLVREEGFFEPTTNKVFNEWVKDNFPHCRHYYLKDVAQEPPALGGPFPMCIEEPRASRKHTVMESLPS
ncbi:hypothetical protein PG990_008832 [Apiospora arundinis]